ncbi:MAG: hypothetical protein PVJ34_02380 [Anaerolineae bacterium]
MAWGMLLVTILLMAGCGGQEVIVPVPPTTTPDWPLPTTAPTTTPKAWPSPLAFPLAAPAHIAIERAEDRSCIACHSNEEELKEALAAQAEAHGSLVQEEEGTGEPPGPSAWERVYLDNDAFLETLHGRYGCIACHGGRGDTNSKEAAHQDLMATPSTSGVCESCHEEEVTADQNSLHASLAGYRTALLARSDAEHTGQLEEMMETHCAPCHTTTCGQCHISRLARVGGGLVAGHLFNDTQAIDQTCAGCHGSRVEGEYKGESELVPGDIHWVQGSMLCSDCHTAAEFHGTTVSLQHRYDGQPQPSCTARDCHPDVREGDGVEQHGDSHLKNLSCQVCHSTSYTNCYGCHVSLEDGTATYEIEPPQMAFKIGRNPLQGRYRPWKYVPVRHVPITPDSFDYYGQDLLPNFDSLPTWKYATPHNIQRTTPQTETCNACHGNADLFLTTNDVAPEELAANRRVIVDLVPEAIE